MRLKEAANMAAKVTFINTSNDIYIAKKPQLHAH